MIPRGSWGFGVWGRSAWGGDSAAVITPRSLRAETTVTSPTNNSIAVVIYDCVG